MDALSQYHPQYQAFCEGLAERLLKDGQIQCDNQHTVSRQILYALFAEATAINGSLRWLYDNGACCCDCEVVYNVFSKYPPQATTEALKQVLSTA